MSNLQTRSSKVLRTTLLLMRIRCKNLNRESISRKEIGKRTRLKKGVLELLSITL
jgi:hypothetical protein